MSVAQPAILISDISGRNFLRSEVSIFRHYQDMFLRRYGKNLTGRVVELGGELKYNHEALFPNATSFTCTNITRDYDEYLNVTDMHFASNSQDAYVCVSVLEHVYNIQKAFEEIERTLKAGGCLLLVIPFAYPIHDEVDFWRVSKSYYHEVFRNYDIKAFVHLGGLISTIVSALQRPRGVYTRRFLVYKFLGLAITMIFKRLDTLDGFPIGYGIYAVKK